MQRSLGMEVAKPKLTNPNYCVKVISRVHICLALNSYGKGKLIDIGCGSGEKKLLIPNNCTYIGLDHAGSLHDKSNVDILATAYEIPLGDCSFDTVLCAAVLEHLEEPEIALREAYRVLRPSGHAIYAIPFFWHLHEEPRDFYRYTKYGIRYLFEKVGFEVVELKPLSGFWVTFGSEWNYYLESWCFGFLSYLVKPIIAVNNIIFFALDKIDRKLHPITEKWTWMYMLVVKKP